MAAGRELRLARALRRSGALSVLRRLPLWRGLLVLCYHRIGDAARSPLDRDLFSASDAEFERLIAYLASNCDVVDAEGAARAMAHRRSGRRVLVTFDDGYRDNHDVAWPVLRRHGVPALLFLATGFLDRPRLSWWDEAALLAGDDEAALRETITRYKALPADRADAVLDELAERTGRPRPGPEAADGVWMTWDMARAMRDGGVDIGGHTHDHGILGRMSPEAQEEQIATGARRLREELGVAQRWFSYPVGSPEAYDEHSVAAARRHGAELAFTFERGYARPGTDPMRIPRLGAVPHRGADQLAAATVLPQLFARPV